MPRTCHECFVADSSPFASRFFRSADMTWDNIESECFSMHFHQTRPAAVPKPAAAPGPLADFMRFRLSPEAAAPKPVPGPSITAGPGSEATPNKVADGEGTLAGVMKQLSEAKAAAKEKKKADSDNKAAKTKKGSGKGKVGKGKGKKAAAKSGGTPDTPAPSSSASGSNSLAEIKEKPGLHDLPEETEVSFAYCNAEEEPSDKDDDVTRVSEAGEGPSGNEHVTPKPKAAGKAKAKAQVKAKAKAKVKAEAKAGAKSEAAKDSIQKQYFKFTKAARERLRNAGVSPKSACRKAIAEWQESDVKQSLLSGMSQSELKRRRFM